MKLRVIGPPRRGNTGDGEGWLVRCMGVRVVGMGRGEEGGDHTSNYWCSDVNLASTFGGM